MTETALELDVDAAGYTRGEGVHFGGFPGVWFPDRPVAVSELGLDPAVDVEALVDELGLPLTLVEVEPGSAPMPERPNHVVSEEQQRILDLEAASNWPPRTHAAADQAAAAASLAWPRARMTVDEKVAFLDEARGAAEEPAAEEGAEG